MLIAQQAFTALYLSRCSGHDFSLKGRHLIFGAGLLARADSFYKQPLQRIIHSALLEIGYLPSLSHRK
jgi:hypothetical protein